MAQPLPNVTVNKTQGTTPAASNLNGPPLFIGPSSLGTVNTYQSFGNPSTLQAAGGDGITVMAAMDWLTRNGGSVNIIFANSSVAASNSAVLSGSGVPTGSVSGIPNNAYQANIAITRAGALGVGGFTFSLDGGTTVSPTVRTLAGTFVIPNTGLTFTFATASYTVGQQYSWNSFPASMNASDFSAAGNVMTGSNVTTTPSMVLVCNDVQSAVSSSALFTAVDTLCTNLQTNRAMPCNFIVPVGGQDTLADATVQASTFAAVACSAGNIVAAVASRQQWETPNSYEGYTFPKVPIAVPVMTRCGAVDPSTAVFWSGAGPLPGILAGSSPTYDEQANGQLFNLINVIAPLTKARKPGTWLNGDYLKCSPGSVYQFLSQGRVINAIDQVLHDSLDIYVGASAQITTPNGTLTTNYANKIDQLVNEALPG